jgi:hypothetical protein
MMIHWYYHTSSRWDWEGYSAGRNLEGMQSENKCQGRKRKGHAYGQRFCGTMLGAKGEEH